jgi:hypothetical protein
MEGLSAYAGCKGGLNVAIKHNSDMFRDGKLPVTSLTDAMQRLVQGFTSSGKMQYGAGLLGEDLHVMIVVGRAVDVNPLLVAAAHMSQHITPKGN